MKTKFFLCNTCGNVVVKVVDSGVTTVCCGQNMIELTPNTIDASKEKHVPIVEQVDDCTIRVKIGSMPHPTTQEHHIMFIYLECEKGGMLKYLTPGKPSEAEFCTCKDKVVAVYSYCNLHGLWKSEVKELSGKDSCSIEEHSCCCKG